jgi:hypothetical protein
LYTLTSQRILNTFISHLFRIQVLGLVIGQITLTKGLKLSPKLINIIDLITGQPLRSAIVLDQQFLINLHFLPQTIKSVLGIGMLKDPNTVRVELGGDGDLLLATEFGAAHGGDGDALQV